MTSRARPARRLMDAAAVALFVALVATHDRAQPYVWWNAALAAVLLAALLRYLATPRRRPAALFSPWVRSLVFPLALLVVVEFVLRCEGYHRTLRYERVGDLLFTPVPNQECLEKISLTPSRINNYGLRGRDLAEADLAKSVVLCLGDSVTFGYGVADDETYPAMLQRALDREAPDGFTVLNAGVNAYPTAFMRQKFLHLWSQGVRPATVIVGYSFNEGWLGDLVDSDAERKDRFERRVHLKNALRGIALYNLIVENWARAYYDRWKARLVPGTHRMDAPAQEPLASYRGALERLLADLRARQVRVVFLLFCSYNAQTDRYDAEGEHQRAFRRVAADHGIPCVETLDVLRPHGADDALRERFVDHCHMNRLGTELLGAALADHPAVRAK